MTMNRRIQDLVQAGIIQRIKAHKFILDDEGEVTDKSAAHYALTENAKMLMLQSIRRYSSIADMKKRLHPVHFRDFRPIFPKRADKGPKDVDYVRTLDEMDTGYDDFAAYRVGIQHLERHKFVILKQNALLTLDKADKAAAIRNLPDDEFSITYKLLKTGRTGGSPYVLHGNCLLPLVRPVHDIVLEHGKLIYLDYGTQEIRLLAYQSQDANLLSAVLYEPDLNQFFQKDVFKGISNGLSKVYRSAISYGANGFDDDLIETTRLYLRENNINIDPLYFLQRHFRAFNELFPQIEVYREEIAQQWLTDGIIFAPGGIKRGIDEELLKKDGTPSIAELRKKGLNHMVQGLGAWIARRLIAGAVHLKYAQLLIPIHDGFIFYLPNDHITEALTEAHKLMDQAADVVPVPTPHKIEWVWDSNGPLDITDYVNQYELGSSSGILSVPTIIPACQSEGMLV